MKRARVKHEEQSKRYPGDLVLDHDDEQVMTLFIFDDTKAMALCYDIDFQRGRVGLCSLTAPDNCIVLFSTKNL
jgi:hypothetical protein